MKKVYLIAISIAFIIYVSGCAGKKSGNTGAADISDITGRYWKLTELYGKTYVRDTLAEGEPHIIFKFQDKSITGHGGCNILYGKFNPGEKNHFSISDMSSTKMACDNMAAESDFFQALKSAENWKLAADTLWLNNAKMELLARFVSVKGK